jgi:hypothetical protein
MAKTENGKLKKRKVWKQRHCAISDEFQQITAFSIEELKNAPCIAFGQRVTAANPQTEPESELDIVVRCEPISVRPVTVNITLRQGCLGPCPVLNLGGGFSCAPN